MPIFGAFLLFTVTENQKNNVISDYETVFQRFSECYEHDKDILLKMAIPIVMDIECLLFLHQNDSPY